jgi:hypothetical protein
MKRWLTAALMVLGSAVVSWQNPTALPEDCPVTAAEPNVSVRFVMGPLMAVVGESNQYDIPIYVTSTRLLTELNFVIIRSLPGCPVFVSASLGPGYEHFDLLGIGAVPGKIFVNIITAPYRFLGGQNALIATVRVSTNNQNLCLLSWDILDTSFTTPENNVIDYRGFAIEEPCRIYMMPEDG